VEALGNTGEPVLSEVFSGTLNVIRVDGEVVNVWEYPDQATAIKEASYVKYDGFDLRRPEDTGRQGYYGHYDWIASPHWYRAGRIIVLYVGRQVATMDKVDGLLGPHYAGEGIGPPPVTDFESFMDNLLLSGARVKAITETLGLQADGPPYTQQRIFSGVPRGVELDGEHVSLLEYEDEAVAARETTFISNDGSCYTSADKITQMQMQRDAPPRFHRAGRIIVLYVGEKQETIALLERLLGPPFAGEGRK
jgi:hypothetical protein